MGLPKAIKHAASWYIEPLAHPHPKPKNAHAAALTAADRRAAAQHRPRNPFGGLTDAAVTGDKPRHPHELPLRPAHLPKAGGSMTAAQIAAKQRELKQAGYNVAVDGVWGPQTASASKAADSGMVANAWNKAQASTRARHAAAGTQAAGHPSSNFKPIHPPTHGGGGGGRTTAGLLSGLGDPTLGRGLNPRLAGEGAQLIDPGLADNGAQLLDPKLANAGAQTYDPRVADQMAGLEFDPQIYDTKVAQARQPVQAAQNMKNIGDWYGDVTKSLETARGRNQEAVDSAAASNDAATQALVASLGGAANNGSGMVAGAGAAGGALIRGMGAAENQYQSDLAPILASEGAGARTSEQARSTKDAQDLAHSLASLEGQRGQSTAAHRFEIDQANNGILDNRAERGLGIAQANNGIRDSRVERLLGIDQANNSTRQGRLDTLLKIGQYNDSLAQQGFSNRLSVAQSNLAARMAGAQIAGLNASSAATRASAKAIAAGAGSVPWQKLAPPDKQQLITAGLSNVVDPSGALLPGLSEDQAWQMVRDYLVGQGYTSAKQAGRKFQGKRNPAATSINHLIASAIAHAKAQASANAAANLTKGQ